LCSAKKNDQTSDIPIIFLTALDSDEDEAKGLELGAVDYITKPFNPAIVRRRVQTQLELKHHREHLEHLIAQKTRELVETYADLKNVHNQMLQQEKMASIGQLAAGVAHEINNPAGFIGSNLGSLQKYVNKLNEGLAFMEQSLKKIDNSELQAEIKTKKRQLKLDFVQEDINDLINESKDGIERIATIVRNLKNFSRTENDKQVATNLQEMLESAINIAWNEIKYKAQIKKEYQALPLITCFPQQLGQVFVNLLVNAAHAIEGQGVITVKTRQENNWAVVEICDTGSGIAEEHLAKLFEPFFTTKEAGKGTGLGLSICHDIIQKHRGLIEVDTTSGIGTSFTIKLPYQ
jgi:two-component system NtrC family sensor kinase